MAIDSLSTWKSTFDALAKQSDWTPDFSTWVDDRVTSKMDLPGIGHASPPAFTFTFAKSTFKAALDLLVPVADVTVGITSFSVAWETAVIASVAVVKALSFIGTLTPATQWSSVTSTVIDPASILLGKAKIIELASEDPDAPSKFPDKFRDAFLLLTVTTTGLDSTPTPTGPLPLVDAARAVA